MLGPGDPEERLLPEGSLAIAPATAPATAPAGPAEELAEELAEDSELEAKAMGDEDLEKGLLAGASTQQEPAAAAKDVAAENVDKAEAAAKAVVLGVQGAEGRALDDVEGENERLKDTLRVLLSATSCVAMSLISFVVAILVCRQQGNMVGIPLLAGFFIVHMALIGRTLSFAQQRLCGTCTLTLVSILACLWLSPADSFLGAVAVASLKLYALVLVSALVASTKWPRPYLFQKILRWLQVGTAVCFICASVLSLCVGSTGLLTAGLAFASLSFFCLLVAATHARMHAPTVPSSRSSEKFAQGVYGFILSLGLILIK